MWEHLRLALSHLIPKKFLTVVAGQLASRRLGWLTKMFITFFVKAYRVDMSEAQNSDVASYRTFNEFFSRPLRDNARPIETDASTLVLPADGIVSQLGHIHGETFFQAKGHDYPLEALLAGDREMAAAFQDGEFVTTYLAPSDYHRVHMPCDGTLREMVYVPGDLHSVNLFTAQHVKNLFARNERVICYFDTDFGPMAQILVGATIVGSIETVWFGTVTPPREGIIKRWPATKEQSATTLSKGQEMGLFKLGSTVITLFSANKITLVDSLTPGCKARLGQPMAVKLRSDDEKGNPETTA